MELDDEYAAAHPGVSPGRHVMLAVTDSGTGMDAATRARVFEPFFTTKEQGKGTGLGLSTVYGSVRQLGGHVWVYSEPGRGSAFKVLFPVTTEKAPAADTSPVSPADVESRGETVLLVEDEAAVREFAARALRRFGYTVFTAAGGPEALRICQAHEGQIDLLLSDVVMPEMGGALVHERVRELRPDIRVLYMSGYTDDAIVRHGILQGELAFISKPFTPYSLARRVREVLDGRPREPGAAT
jgi:CheY-like chemotaxis protein